MKFLSTLFLFLISFLSIGQESEPEEKRFRLAIATINSHVPALDNDFRVVVPAWGFEFEYRLKDQFLLIANVEFELLKYVVKEGDDQSLRREFPFITSLLVGKEFNERFIFAAGFGREFEPNENFNLLIFNFNYLIRLPDNWDVSPGVTYNHRLEAFNTYSLNIAFGKSF